MSDTTSTAPKRPDIDALRGFTPDGTSAVCFNATFIVDVVAWIDHLEQAVATASSYHGNSIDPTECQECEEGHYPCRTARALDVRQELGR